MKDFYISEKILKRYLKRRISITTSLIVGFLIIGGIPIDNNVVLARDLRVRNAEKNEIKFDSSELKKNTSANGTDVINITNPDKNGISHNKFIDFSVGSENGVIFNNSKEHGVSQIGGYLTKNPNLEKNATTILNEVTGNKSSNINGTVEIFGKKADFILANENGINLNGANFINTNGVTLTTGKINKGENNLNFDINKGNVKLNGVSTSGDYFNVLANTIEVYKEISPLKGEKQPEISFIAGENKISLDNNKMNNPVINEIKKSKSEKYGITAGALGAMYGKNIRLISTADGLGVRHEGAIFSGGDIVIESNGDISTKILSAKNKIKIAGDNFTSKAGVVKINGEKKNASISAGDNLNIEVKENVNLQSGIQSIDGNINIKSKNLTLEDKTSARIISKNGVSIKTSDRVDVQKVLLPTVKGVPNEDLIVDEDLQVKNVKTGKIYKDKEVTWIEGGIFAKELEIYSKDLENRGIISAKDTNINSEEKISNLGTINGSDRNSVKSKNITNSGTLQSENNILLKSEGKFINKHRVAGKSIDFSADELENDGLIVSNKNIDLNYKNNLENKGVILSGDKINLNGKEGKLDNSGEINSKEKIEIDGKDISNRGKITGKDIELNISNEFENFDSIQSVNNLEINNRGSRRSLIKGEIKSGGNTKIDSLNSEVILSGDILSGKNIDILSQKDIINEGMIAAKDNILLKADGLVNGEGKSIWAGKNITVDAKRGIYNNAKANILSVGDLTLAGKEIENDGGNIISNEKLKIRADKLINRSKIEQEAVSLGTKIIQTKVRWNDIFNYHLDSVIFEIPVIENKSIIKNKANIEANKDIDISGYSLDRAEVINESGKITTPKNLKISGNILNKTEYKELSVVELLKMIKVTLSWESKLYLTNAHANGGITFRGSLYDALINSYFGRAKEGYYRALTQTDDKFINELISTVLGAEWKDKKSPIPKEKWNLDESFKYYAANGGAQIVVGENFEHVGDLYNDGGEIKKDKELEISIGDNSINGIVLNSNIDTSDINKIKEVDKVKYIHDIELATGSVTIDGVTINAESGNLKSSIAVAGTIAPTVFIEIPEGEDGIFKAVVGEAQPGQPLFETNIKFIDPDNFYGSEYFFEQIGYEKNSSSKVLGDAYYEYLLISRMLREGVRYSNKIEASNIKELLDNAIQVGKKLELTVGEPLTKEQIEHLDRDIIWYVELEVDGHRVLAPQIYFGKENRIKMIKGGEKGGFSSIDVGKNFVTAGDEFINTNGSINVDGDIFIRENKNVINDSLDGVNSGINSGKKIYVESLGNINMLGSQTEAVEGIELKANGNIDIKGGNLLINENSNRDTDKKEKNINLDAEGDINISNTYKVSSEADYNSGDYQATESLKSSAISKNSSIKGENINIKGKNINIKGGDILAKSEEEKSGTISLNAKENINIEDSKELEHFQNKEHKVVTENGILKSKSLSEDMSAMTSKGSSLEADGNINLLAGKNLNLKGSSLESKENIQLSAERDINILDGRDEVSNTTSNFSFQGLGFNYSNEKKSASLSKGSSIKAEKDIEIDSNSNVKLINGKINSKGKTQIDALGDIKLEAGKDEFHENIYSLGLGLYAKGYIGVGDVSASGEASAFSIKRADGSPTAPLPTYPTGSGGTMLDPLTYGSIGIGFENYFGTTDKVSWKNSNLSAEDIKINSKRNVDIGGADIKADKDITVNGMGIFSSKYQDSLVKKEKGISLYVEDNMAIESSGVDVANKLTSMVKNGKELDPVVGTLQSVGAVTTLALNDAIGVGNYLKAGFIAKTSDTHSTSDNITNISGKNIHLNAMGNNLNLLGVDISADENIYLDSAKDINIKSVKNTTKSHKLTADGELRFGQGASINPIYGAGVGMNMGFHGSADTFDENSVTEVQSKISGENIFVNSKENVNIKGGNIDSKKGISLKVGKDLNIESVVSTKESEKKFGSVGGRLGIGIASNTIVRGNLSTAVGGGHITSHEEKIDVSGITAGNNLDVSVGKDLNITAGVLGSKENKGGIKVGNNINVKDIYTSSQKGGVDIVASVGQAGEIGVTGSVADKLDKTTVTNSAIKIKDLENSGKVLVNGEEKESKDIKDDIDNNQTVIKNTSSKGGIFSIIGPVKAGSNAIKSHKTGSYDVN